MYALLPLSLLGLVAGMSEAPIRRHFDRRQSNQSSGQVVPRYNFTMPVDHFNASDTRTYSNRFWVNDTWYQPGGPVILYDFGEAGVSQSGANSFLAELGSNNPTAPLQLARSYHGLVIGWEHRYYGLSLPVPFVLKNGTAVDGLTCARNPTECTFEPVGGVAGYQYLTVEQALEDLVYFANNLDIPGHTSEELALLAPTNTPWIFLGGSYPGCRAAWVRIRNPEIFFASWASSAPVEASFDGSPYIDGVYLGLPETCAADIVAVTQYVDEILDGKHGLDALTYLQELVHVAIATGGDQQAWYNLANATELTPDQIGGNLSEPLTKYAQERPPLFAAGQLCQYMQSYNPAGVATNATNQYVAVLTNSGDGDVSDGGIVDNYGVLEGLNAYIFAAAAYLGGDETEQEPASTNATTRLIPIDKADEKAWNWQAFTQFGFQQGSNPDRPTTIMSRYYNYSFVFENDRKELYTFNVSEMPEVPDVDSLNQYGGWDMKVSNVMFTNGQYDPWRQFGVDSEQTTNSEPRRNYTQDVPQCGQVPDGTDVFGLLYPGAVHVPDFGVSAFYPMDGNAPIQVGLALFKQALDVWLPCFESRNSSNSSNSSQWGDWRR